MTRLELDVDWAPGAFRLEAELALEFEGVACVFGRSGAGKSSLLRVLAGLEPSARGRAVLDGIVWHDAAAGTFLAPHARRVGFVFQDAALFPHLDVAGNLAFGAARVPRSERRIASADVIDWLELGPLLERDVRTLSGGEARRVALARALAASPRLLLLDEPLTGLDREARRTILPMLESLATHFQLPVILVSHSMAEVARLANVVVWLEAGRVAGIGSPADVLPRAVAHQEEDDLGVAVEGLVSRHHDADELTEVSVGRSRVFVRRVGAEPGQPVRLLVFARDVSVGLQPERRSSILNELPAEVVAVHPAVGGVVLGLRLEDGQVLLARITRRSERTLELVVGSRVLARVKGVSVAGVGVPRA